MDDQLDNLIGRMARMDHRPHDAPRSPLSPAYHSRSSPRFQSPSRSPSQLSSHSSARSLHSLASASGSNRYDDGDEDDQATPNPNANSGTFASPASTFDHPSSNRHMRSPIISRNVSHSSSHSSSDMGSPNSRRLQPRSAKNERTPLDDLEFFKESMGSPQAYGDGDQWSEHGSETSSMHKEARKVPSQRSLRLRADIERTAQQLRAKASQEALGSPEILRPPSSMSRNSESSTTSSLPVPRKAIPQAVQIEADELERQSMRSTTTSMSERDRWPSSPKGSVVSMSTSLGSVAREGMRERDDRNAGARHRPKEMREWSQVCWVWMREKASGGLMSKAPLIREVPNVMKRKMGSKRDSSQLLGLGGEVLSTPDDKPAKGQKGVTIGPSSSGREGTFKKVTGVLRDDGYLRIYSEDKLILHAIYLPSISRSDIHIVDQSLFSRKNCVVIHRRNNTSATHGLGLGSSAPMNSGRDEPIYLCLPSSIAMQTWIVMAHCFAAPEFYLAGGAHVPRSKHKRSESGGGYGDTTDTDSTDDLEDEIVDSCRINRTVTVTVNEGKNLGEMGSVRGPLRTTDRRPGYDREGSGSTASFDSLATDSSPGKRLHRGGADSSKDDGAQVLDTYCEVVIDGDIAARTAVKRATAAPFWSETFVFSELPPLVNPILVRVLQYHKNSRPTFIGAVTVRPADLPRGIPFNEWYAVRPASHERGRATDAMGELSLTVRVDEQVVLPSHEYLPMLTMLNNDKEAELAKDIAHEFSSDLEEITKVLMRIYQAESQLIPRILRLAEQEIDGDIKSAAILFRGNSILTKSVELYLRLVGVEFLETAIGEPVRRLCAEKVEVEIDPSRMKQGYKEKEMTANVAELMEWTVEVWNSIYDAREKCPNELRQIFAHIQQVVMKKYGEDQKKMRSTCVSAFVFLRFFVPAVLNPKLFGLVSSPPDPKSQRTLTLIAKTLQGLANFSTFGQKEPWMLAMDPFVQNNTSAFVDYIEHISTPSIASRYEWTSPHSPVYLASYRLRNSLSPATREGVPLLPHLIDLPRELGVLASFVARGTLEKGVMPFFESRESTRSASGKPNVQSDKFSKFTDVCVEAHVEAQRRGGGLVGTVQNTVGGPRDDSNKIRARSATVRTSDAWSTNSVRQSQIFAQTPPSTMPGMPESPSGSVASRRSHRSFTVGGIPPRLGSLPTSPFAAAAEEEGGPESSNGDYLGADVPAHVSALRNAGLTPDETAENSSGYAFPGRPLAPRVERIRMVQEVTTIVETVPLSSSSEDEDQAYEEASSHSPADSPPFSSIPMRQELSNSSTISVAEVSVGGAPNPNPNLNLGRRPSAAGVLLGELGLVSKMMKRKGSGRSKDEPPAKIAVIYSSTYGHVRTLAEKIAEAAKATGATVDLFQFPEILSAEVLGKMHAAPKSDAPIITPDAMKEYDGFLFGFPTRYGRAVGAASAFFDSTGGLWMTGALVGKAAGIFTSSASQHGGQETTALTTIPYLAHQGLVFVPIGFANKNLTDNTEIVGGSAYGASAIAGGDGSRGLTEKELDIAAYQGTSFASFVNTFVAGKSALASQSTETAPVAAKELPARAEGTNEAGPYDTSATTDKPAPAPVPAPTPAPTPAAKPAPQKSAGLFASCCGGAKENYDS